MRGPCGADGGALLRPLRPFARRDRVGGGKGAGPRRRPLTRIIAIVALVVVAGCGSANPAPKAQAQVPTDGVHMSGAFTGVYPISSGGKCNVATLNADK